MISVYPSSETKFENNGIKILHPIKAKVYKQDNGDFYLEIKDTLDNLSYYQEGLIVRTDTPWGKQGFRLTNPEIDKDKIICKGKHLYFDTSRYIIVDSYVVDKNCNDALDHLNNGCDAETPFKMISDVQTINSYRCVRQTLEEALSVVIERWGGHLVRDNFNIGIRETIGEDRGVTLSYAKNIHSIKAVEVWDNVVTKLLPIGKDGLLLPEIWVGEASLYDIPYTKTISFDQSSIVEEDFQINGVLDEEAYSDALINDLRKQANNYLSNNKIPLVNYTLSANIQDVSDIGDTIYVKHPKCNIDIVTNVIAIEYDCILEKYTKIEFGNFKNKLGDLITNITNAVNKEVAKENNNSYAKFHAELEDATNKINSVMGNSYVIYDGSQIMVVDKLPKEEATNVILINNGGIGFSQNGINGTFRSAWTIDGTLNMQNINVINLVADLIKGGTLKLGGNSNSNGQIEIYDVDGNEIGRIDNNGFSIKISENIENVSEKMSEVSQTLDGVEVSLEEFKTDAENKFSTIIDLEQLKIDIESGVTNTFSTSGGSNLIRNSALLFEENENKYEYWDGLLKRNDEEDDSETGTALLIQADECLQTIQTLAGNYFLSFKYKKLIELTTLSIFLNNVEYQIITDDLEINIGEEYEYQLPFAIDNPNITLKFISNTNDGAEIYNLMLNKGVEKVAYTQHQNEITSSTVKIGKGIQVESTNDLNTITKIDGDGFRVLSNDEKNEVLLKATDKGTYTKTLECEGEAKISGLFIQKVDEQVWITGL